ncbi:MAG: cation diffusion facilitator family transporter [Oscillospiraceae bacterium]|nr:cation diffusion facilitator family transporter [Oscillospiraceae bacterium]
MKLLYRLLKQDPNSREGVVLTTSALGIAVNLLLAGLKVAVGAAVSSIAVVSEGVNNAADSATSLLTIVGTKLSGRRPNKKHPFGFGRIEYLTSLVIAVFILVTGLELFISSVKLIFEPAGLSVSISTMLLIAVSALVKLALGTYTVRMGKKVGSGSLVAVGTDCRSDSVISVVTILSAAVWLIFRFSVDAYAGIITSAFILKAGFDILRDTASDLLGKAAEKDLADALYREIRAVPVVLNAADMMLHNYGPDAYSGSVNIEVDHEKTIGEVYEAIHALQLRIMHEYGVTMVFGMYAVDSDHEEVRRIRADIASYVRANEHIVSYHALYLTPDFKQIYCDFVVDYELKDWDGLKADFGDYMGRLYPESELVLTIETEFV